jgi:hypothetical protein
MHERNWLHGHTTDGKKYYIERYEIMDKSAKDIAPRSGHKKELGKKSYCALFFSNDSKYEPCCDPE